MEHVTREEFNALKGRVDQLSDCLKNIIDYIDIIERDPTQERLVKALIKAAKESQIDLCKMMKKIRILTTTQSNTDS